MSENVQPDGTVVDALGNFVGIDQPAATRQRYAIRFTGLTAEPIYAGMFKDALGFAPTLETALIYDDHMVAERVLLNGYGSGAAAFGDVIAVQS